MSRSAARKRPRARAKRRGYRFRIPKIWPSARLRRLWLRTLRSSPPAVQVIVCVAAFLTLWLGLNWIYQVVRKPSELFFPISSAFYRTPAQTWGEYASMFRRHSTQTISAELLAAFAQVEGSGNPVVRTYWRWSLTHEPFEVYRPASSAVGMFQMTDGTFEQARRYCVHDHVVVEDGPWHDWRSCWFNSLYTRTIAGHAAELTSAHLDRSVAGILQRRRIAATLQQKQDLAAVIHLCGAGAGERYARRKLKLLPGQRCGDHDVRTYLQRINGMKRTFAQLAQHR
jgi:hypothetical protein